jgi:hypothetical protein
MRSHASPVALSAPGDESLEPRSNATLKPISNATLKPRPNAITTFDQLSEKYETLQNENQKLQEELQEKNEAILERVHLIHKYVIPTIRKNVRELVNVVKPFDVTTNLWSDPEVKVDKVLKYLGEEMFPETFKAQLKK